MQKLYVTSCRILMCITTRYSSLILLWKCGTNALRQNQAGAISLPVWTSALLELDVMENPRRSHVATFGISVAADMQGRGVGRRLMSEMINLCDNWLRIERIELTVFADNPSAVALYKNFGFEIEGTGKKFALRNGEYVDAYYMARMK